ncbi:40S ribosomal protein S6 [Paramarasmius palmivorus]|uniref:40S ribosomal protein S6 n=1 Tax=Paramarasmius palmivorus TaxID=297713 RepID=A0AAW0CRT5_9AGAR
MAANTVPDAALQLSSSTTPDISSYLTYIITLAPDIASVIWRYIRFQYPCITIAELEIKEGFVDALRDNVLRKGYLRPSDDNFEDMAQRRSDLKMNASEIRTRSLETASSAWSYIGFHPAIVSDIVAWNREADQYERELLLITEARARERLRRQQNRNLVTSFDGQQTRNVVQTVSPPPLALTRQNRRYTEGSSSLHSLPL